MREKPKRRAEREPEQVGVQVAGKQRAGVLGKRKGTTRREAGGMGEDE